MREALKKAAEARQAMKAAGIKVVQLDPIQKSKANPLSKALAIKAKCCECMGGPETFNYKNEIKRCTGFSCPLHSVRPYQEKAQEGGEEG